MNIDKTELFVKKIINVLNLKLSNKMINILVQIFKFCIVGGIATLLDWIIYFILFNYFSVEPLIANIISFSLSMIYNFVASVRWVFDVDKDKSKISMFIWFVSFSLIGLLITEILLYIFIYKIFIGEMISKIIATIIVMIFNFVTRKMFLEKHN